MLAEALIWGAALLSTRPRRLWVRCSLALAVLVPWGLYTIQIVMHAPVYVHFHHLWLWLVILSLVVTAIASGTMHAVSFARERREAV
jgi:ABC-type multidrug transport system permease subunit